MLLIRLSSEKCADPSFCGATYARPRTQVNPGAGPKPPWARRRRSVSGSAPGSQPLEPADPLPVGDRGLERLELDIGGVHVVIDHGVAERPPGHLAGREQVPGLEQAG